MLLIFEELPEIVGEFVIEVCVQCPVQVMTERMLAVYGGADHNNVRGFHLIEERVRLACVKDQKHFLVQMLHIHFMKDLGEVFTMHDLSVLDLEEVLSSMPIHVNEDFGLLVPLQLLRCGEVSFVPTSNQIQDVIVSEIFTLIIDLDVRAIEVAALLQFIVKLPWVWIACIAGVVLWKHKNDAVISHSHGFEVLIDDKGVARVAVVEIELGTT